LKEINFDGLIHKLAKRYSFGDYERYRELLQTGAIGLFKAQKKYNPHHDSKASFSTWAYINIRGEMLHYLRSFPAEEPIIFTDKLEEQPIPDPKMLFSHSYENRDYIEYLLSQLNPDESLILRHVYLQELTQKETARLLNKTEMSVSRAVKRGLAKLRTSCSRISGRDISSRCL
jgi:RNA polymerase sigma factor (sigma-70 family)